MSIEKDTIYRYLNGDLSGQDREKVARWLLKKENFSDYLHWKQIWLEAGLCFAKEEVNEEAAGEVLRMAKRREGKKEKRLAYLFFFSKVAAVFVPIIFFVAWWHYNRSDQVGNFAEYQTAFGENKEFVLADGSRVRLNAMSNLKVVRMGDIREVRLQGEGMFHVKSDPEHPFIVSVPDLSVKVTGTVFNIKAYSDDEEIGTTLLEGCVGVKLENAESYAELRPGEKASYMKALNSLEVSKVDVRDWVAWQDGRIVFKNEPLEQIVRRLKRWYGVDFELEKALQTDERYRGIFLKDKSVEQAVQVLSDIVGCIYKVKLDNGKRIFLLSRN